MLLTYKVLKFGQALSGTFFIVSNNTFTPIMQMLAFFKLLLLNHDFKCGMEAFFSVNFVVKFCEYL
jgi:hypothetical protein